MQNYNISLLKKFSIAIIIILCPIIITFIFNYYSNKKDLNEHIKNDLSVIAEAYELQIYQFVEMSRRRVTDFSSDGIIRDHFQRIIDGKETGDQFLNDYLLKNKKILDSSIHSISLMTFDGLIHASTDRTRIGKSFVYELSVFEKNMPRPVGEMETSFSGFEQIVVMAPVFSKTDDKPIGIIVNHIYLTELNRILSGELVADLKAASWREDEQKHIHKHKTMEAYLVNKDKLMITESKFVENSILKQVVDTPPVLECIERNRGLSGFYKDYRGINVAGASMCIPSMKWVLIVEIDEAEVLSPLADMRNNALIGSSIVIGLIILFFIFMVRKIIIPLKHISGAAESIASGNYDVTIPVQTGDEIGTLAGLFNKMGQEIKYRAKLIQDSEERLRAIIDNSAAVIYLKDTEGKYILVNRRFEELFGLSVEQINGKTDFDIFPEEMAARFRENDLRVLETRSPLEFDEIAPHDDGIHDYLSVKFPVFNVAGIPLAVCGISTDITERKRLTEEQFELQRKYEDLVNNLNVGIFRISEKGDIAEVNKSAIMLSEAGSKEELQQHNVRDFFNNHNDFKVFIDGILKNGSVENLEPELKTLKGNKFYASISAIRRRDKDGKLYVDGVIEDITKLKKLEMQLRIAQKMESVGQLAGGIAHDFNNILTGITGYSTLLSMKTDTDQVLKGYASHIITLAEKAANLTQGLLAFSRKQVMNVEVHNLNEIARRFINMVSRIIGEKIEVTGNLCNNNLPVFVDPAQIEQVLMNLATNSKDAMAKGGTISIETSMVSANDIPLNNPGLATTGYYALLKFTDSGTGIPADVRDKIFDPFFTTKEVGKGTGLGLSIVHGIIEQHNGIIEVESESGYGTTFNIFIPVTDVLVAKHKGPAEFFNLPHGKETILLAEDDKPTRATAKTILEEFGYHIIEAYDGEDAVNQFTTHKDDIHLVIMDMIMPRKDGRAAFEEIRKINPDIKVIFTSGYLAEMIKVRDIIEEELNFISKPVAPEVLLTKIREVIEN